MKSRVPEMGLCAVERQEGPETGLVWGDRKAQRQGWWSGETGGPGDGAGGVERQEGPETGLAWGDRKAQRQGWWSGETGEPRDRAGVG